MKAFREKIVTVVIALALCFGAVSLIAVPARAETSSVSMHRLYNPNSGEHFYTASTAEKDYLVSVGWNYEGTAWNAPISSNTPVYRLYNPNAGDHHYTTSLEEKNYLISVGWNDEGIGWYSDDAQGAVLYRLYNPNAVAGSHHYTMSAEEKNYLVSVGWNYEGTCWYGVCTHDWENVGEGYILGSVSTSVTYDVILYPDVYSPDGRSTVSQVDAMFDRYWCTKCGAYKDGDFSEFYYVNGAGYGKFQLDAEDILEMMKYNAETDTRGNGTYSYADDGSVTYTNKWGSFFTKGFVDGLACNMESYANIKTVLQRTGLWSNSEYQEYYNRMFVYDKDADKVYRMDLVK